MRQSPFYVSLCVLVLSLSMVGAASAVEAYTIGTTSLRTGPDFGFPRIERVGAGTLVDVFGCIDGYRWCDVDVEGERGWILGQQLEFTYLGRTGPVDEFAPLLGLMILNFSLHDYWDQHYQNRPWYTERNRQRWENWQPRQRPAPFNAPMPGQPLRGQSQPLQEPSQPLRGQSQPLGQAPSGEPQRRNGPVPFKPFHPEGSMPHQDAMPHQGSMPHQGGAGTNQPSFQRPQNGTAPSPAPQRGAPTPNHAPAHKKACAPNEVCP